MVIGGLGCQNTTLFGAPASVLVSFFEDRHGEEYFMVVNLVRGENMSKMDGLCTLRLSFDKDVTEVERLNRLTGLVETLLTTDGDTERFLDI